LNNKRWETELKVRNYYNETFQLQNQLDQYQQNYVAFNTLLRNEELRFTNGESSLFMINSRENKVMETQEKLVELRIKYFKSYYAIQWSAGLLR
jgi:outer membrane protein TolC